MFSDPDALSVVGEDPVCVRIEVSGEFLHVVPAFFDEGFDFLSFGYMPR